MNFSALLCLYRANDVFEVREAIESAFFQQTLPPNELVIVFDGPVPAPICEYVTEVSKLVPTQIIKLATNQGHGVARAKGIEACIYEWIAIIDADDISLPKRFELLIQEIETYPNVSVVGGGVQEFVVVGGARKLCSKRTFPASHEEIAKLLRTRSPVAQCTAMLRRDDIIQVGNYQSWFNNEDYHLWIRLVCQGKKIRNIPQQVLLFRITDDTYFRRGGIKYWWYETKLQFFSLSHGTTTLYWLFLGVSLRFAIQVVMPNSLRARFYRFFLRK